MTQSELRFITRPGGEVQGRLRVPGDKSISHRSIMLGALAEGTTQVSAFLDGEDCLATLNAFRAMGVPIEITTSGSLSIQGVGLHGLQAPQMPLYLGNSGTSMRLMTGLLAGQAFDVALTGDASLSRRPMRRVTEPLTRMGAQIDTAPEGRPPLTIHGGHALHGLTYAMPIASAQVKSSLLLAGLYAEGETCVIEPAPTRDHTERMLKGFGYPVDRQGEQVCLRGGGRLTGTRIDVPADISSAAFFLVAASITPHAELWLEHVGVNPTRTGVIEILKLMGAQITLHNQREIGGEPVADLQVQSAPLHGIDIPEALVPLAIDEFPVLFVAASFAEGVTRLTGAAELRVKESDRIQVMADGLQACGGEAEATPDGIVIRGKALRGGVVESHGDHRIAMAFSIAGIRALEPIEIHDCENVNTSFPGFVEACNRVGMKLEQMQ